MYFLSLEIKIIIIIIIIILLLLLLLLKINKEQHHDCKRTELSESRSWVEMISREHDCIILGRFTIASVFSNSWNVQYQNLSPLIGYFRYWMAA